VKIKKLEEERTKQKTEQEEAEKIAEEKVVKEEALIKVEKCKSEYTAKKEKMITEFNNYEFPLKELKVKKWN